MKKRFEFIIFISLIFVLSTPSFSGEGGVFLKVPVSAKAGAMGDTFVPSLNDAFSGYYNPAGMSFVKNSQLSYIYHSYIQDITGNSFSFIYPSKFFSFGVSYTKFSMEKEHIYDSSGIDTGESCGFSGVILPISVSYKIGNLAIGGSYKMYKEDMGYDNIDDKANTFDFGAVYKLNKFEFSFASQNNGGKMWDDYSLVNIQRYGISYTGNKFILAGELRKEGDDTKFDGGVEYSLLDFLRLRAGIRTAEDFGGPTFGAGISLGAISFDYAFLGYGDLGNIHKAGVSIYFGNNEKNNKVSNEKENLAKPINSAPQLLWLGEGNYLNGGVYPEKGDRNTKFVYRVKYKDVDGDMPEKASIKLHVLKGNTELRESPFLMRYISGSPEKGSVYEYSLRLPRGSDYSYYFSAKDLNGNDAKGAATSPADGPIVSDISGAISGQMNVAVADFTGKNVSEADASIVADFLRTELVNTRAFNVMDRNNMETILAEQKFQSSGCTEQQCAVQMGKLLNVKRMFVGSLSKLLDTYYITVNIVDVETGKILTSIDKSARSSKELREACKEIAQELVK
jgi:hypothetical protein